MKAAMFKFELDELKKPTNDEKSVLQHLEKGEDT